MWKDRKRDLTNGDEMRKKDIHGKESPVAKGRKHRVYQRGKEEGRRREDSSRKLGCSLY